MMREILFRGKREDNGEWIFGSLHIEYGEADRNGNKTLNYRILGMRGECDYVDPETVGQDTGLTDKNGTKIFEGDIVRYMNKETMVISYHNESASFVGTYSAVNFNYCASLMSANFYLGIIGNIHDSQELIGGKKDD